MEPSVRRRSLPVLPGPQVPLRSGRRERRRPGGAGRPAGPFRRGGGAGAPGRPARGGRRGRGARGRRICRTRSTAPRSSARSADTIFRLGARAAQRPQSGLLARASLPGALRGPVAARRRGRRARVPAVLERLEAVPGVSRLGARDRSTSRRRYSSTPPSACSAAAGELIAQVVGDDRRRGAGAARASCRRGRRGALEALARFGARAARRDRAESRPAGLRHRRGAVPPPAAPRARAGGGRARAVALRAAPAGGDRGAARRRWRPSSERRRGASWWTSCASDAAATASCSTSTGASSNARAHFVVERDLVAVPVAVRSRWCRRRRSSRRWCRSPRTSRRRSILGAAAGPLLRHPSRPVAAAGGVRPSSCAGHCRHAIPGDGGARGLSRAPSPARHRAGARLRGAAPHLDPDHGGRVGALLRAAHGGGRLLPQPRSSGSSSWSICSGGRCGSCWTSVSTPAG